jgi:hypothetical protein
LKPNEGNVWFYIRDHQQQGPVSLFELKKLFEHGILTCDTFIWNKDMVCWQKAKTLNLFPDANLETAAEAKIPKNDAGEWKEVKKAIYPNGRPIVRYLARFFDLSLFTFVFITFVSIFSPKFVLDFSGYSIFVFCLIFYIFAESAILSIFGNTLGKSLLNLHLKTVNGDPIDFPTAFQRSIFVNAAGMGLGVPIINFICFLFSYRDLKKHGFSTWDKQIGTVVLYGRVSFGRILFVSLFPIALFIIGFII